MEDCTNKFGEIGSKYIKYLHSIAENLDQMDNLNLLLDCLPSLKLDNNYVLDDFRARNETDSSLVLVARHKSTKRPNDKDFDKWRAERIAEVCKASQSNSEIPEKKPLIQTFPPFDYITVPCNEEAIWQAYLLAETNFVIGLRWHAGYSRREFINCWSDLDEITEDKNDLFYQFTQEDVDKFKTKDILPTVNITTKDIHIRHCWFNSWNGLIQVESSVEYDKVNNRIIDFHSKEVLLKEHGCLVMF